MSIVSDSTKAWHAYYIEQRLYRRDFRVRRAATSSIPFFGSEILGEADGSDEDRAFARLGAEYGLHESYVMPHRTADSRLFAVVMIGPRGPVDPAYRVAALCFSSALLLAALRIEAASLRASPAGARPRLTRRQLECLEWSRLGKSSADIGNILGLSPRTIDEHIAAACQLLGVRTRVQAVSTALTQGLLPYPASPGGARNP
ncbi:MAG TPA: LuxR C-terminal-related transcriptional regulator [Caulobacteraceae bacterium]|jgi:DNA-binding CsgD family transcriptional regulator